MAKFGRFGIHGCAVLGQGFKDMSPSKKELMKLVLEQKIAHGGNVLL